MKIVIFVLQLLTMSLCVSFSGFSKFSKIHIHGQQQGEGCKE